MQGLCNKKSCLGKTAKEKKFSVTYYRAEYERNNARVKSKRGKHLKKKRSSTVEPVFGTLTQFMGMRKINTRGLSQANKVMHMAAIAYNLKKYLKFTKNLREIEAQSAKKHLLEQLSLIRRILLGNALLKMS